MTDTSFEAFCARRATALELLALKCARGRACVYDMLHQIKLLGRPTMSDVLYIDIEEHVATVMRDKKRYLVLRYVGTKAQLPALVSLVLALDGAWSREVPYVIAPQLELTVFTDGVLPQEVVAAVEALTMFGILTENDLLDFERRRRASRQLPPLVEVPEMEVGDELPSPPRATGSWWSRLFQPFFGLAT